MGTKKLKIAVVVDQLLPGGVQKAAIDEVRNLLKLGCETKLIILMRKGFEKKSSYLVKDIPHEFLSDRYPKLLQKSFKLPFFTFLSTLHLLSPVLAPFVIKPAEFDLIISHGTTTTLATWSIANFHKIPYFAVIHDPAVYILDKVYAKTQLRYFFPILKPIATFLEAVFTRAAARCLVDSSVHANYLEKNYGVKSFVLSLGVKPPRKLPKKRGSAILAFGRWDFGKNPLMLLKIIERIPKAKLIIAGSWSRDFDFRQFRKHIKSANLLKRVKLIPKYTEDQLAKICQKARLWVHPHFEAFSLSALEAASYGLPIVIPAKSGVTEIFQDGRHGFFPKKIRVSDFQKAILKLIADERLAYKMGRAGAKIARVYTPKERALKLLEYIDKVLSKPVKIIALETGHIAGSLVAGGDRLLEEMVKRLKDNLVLTLIVPKIGQRHWTDSGLSVEMKTLSQNIFEKSTGPFGVFFNYQVRIWQSFNLLGKIAKENKKTKIVAYSSTNIWPDVIPVYLTKIFKPEIIWLARIHHLLAPPLKRPGRLWVNLGSAILEKLTHFAICSKANLILVLNSELKKTLKLKGFLAKKMVILGGGVDFRAISNLKTPKNKKFDGVYLGRIHPAKGIFDLVPIWQIVVKKKPGAKLTIIGTGPTTIVKNLKEQIKAAKLENNIIFSGFLPQKRVWQALKASKVFLFTDHEAGFGLAAAESLAAGTPIVGWDIGVLGSVFKSGFWVVPQNNHHLFAEKICLLLGNQRLHQKLSKLAMAEAAKFDWGKISLKFQNILDQISN